MQLLKNAPVAVKVALAPIIAMFCLLAVGVVGLWMASELSTSLKQIEARTLPSLSTMSDLQRRLGAVFAATNQSAAWTGAEFPAKRIEELDKATIAELKALEQVLEIQVRQGQWDAQAKTQLVQAQKLYADFKRAALDSLDLVPAGLIQAATFMQSVEDTYRKVDAQIALLSDTIRRDADRAIDESAAAAVQKSWAIAVATLFALCVSSIACWWGFRLIVHPLREAASMAVDMAKGDLTFRKVQASRDETGRVLGAMGEVNRSLSSIVVGIRATAIQVREASNEISCGNADLSNRTERNSAGLQEAAASMEQLTQTIRFSAERAKEALSKALDASSAAQRGGALVTDVVSQMESIDSQAKRIGEIIGTIDGIAAQTNILALNAAVEAARAGEQGRGFGVVASEVRSLANRSAESAGEIRALIQSTVEQIGAGSEAVQSAGRSMIQIIVAVESVAQTIEEISRAAAETAAGITQVNRTVADMDRSTQQNAALVEQASAATSALSQHATHLVESISQFKVASL